MDIDAPISFKREEDDPPSPLRAAALEYPEKHRRLKMPPLITQPPDIVPTEQPASQEPEQKKEITLPYSMERLVSSLFKKVVETHGPLYKHSNPNTVNSHLERIRQLLLAGWTLGVESARGLANPSDGYKVPNSIIAALLDDANMTGKPISPDWNALSSEKERLQAASKFIANAMG
jgi:hypothetical protein